MVMFLNGATIISAARELIRDASDVRLAVAYWGIGAMKELGLDKRDPRSVRILCDLASGACNPDEVKRLVDRFGGRVRALPALHAKVYLSDRRAIIGSANASASGMGWEGAETAALHEGAVAIDNVEVLGSVVKWFDLMWRHEDSAEITDRDIASARAAWERRRKQRPGAPGSKQEGKSYRSMLELLSGDPAAFKQRGLSITWYPDRGLSSAGEKADKQYKRDYDLGDEWECYEDDYKVKYPRGETLIDCCVGRSPALVKLWHVPEQPVQIRVDSSPRTWLTYVRKLSWVDLPGIGRLRLSTADRKEIMRRASLHTESEGISTLHDFLEATDHGQVNA